MTDLQGKVVLITGASSGIGEATSIRLAKAGATVALIARRKDKLDAVVAEITKDGGQAQAFEADVTNEKTCQQVVGQVIDAYSRIDILINNAGVMLNGPALEAPLEEWQQMVDINLKGLLYMTHAILPIMKKQGNGHIVNTSSVAGRTTRAGSAVYNATKWGVNAFTDALRQELSAGKTGIKTTLIEPGAVATELQGHQREAVQKQWKETFGDITILEAEDIAEAMYFAVSQPERVSINEILIRPTEQAG